jgi:hypothetical protein
VTAGDAALEIGRTVITAVLLLGPVAFWLWKVRARDPGVGIVFVLPLFWLAPFAVGWAWILLPLGESRAAPVFIGAALAAQAAFSAVVIVRRRRIWPPVAAWVAINVPFALACGLFAAMATAGRIR